MNSESIEAMYWSEARRKIEGLRSASKDPLVQQIVEKGLVELALKEGMLSNPSISTDLTTYSPIKRVGMFVFVHQTAEVDWLYTDGAFQINAGDEYLNVHIPPAEEGAVSLANVTNDYTRMAEYTRDFLPNLKYLVGITYARLARTGKRQNYTSFPIDVPQELRAPMKAMYERYINVAQNGKPPGPTVLSYHTRKSFLDQFGVK